MIFLKKYAALHSHSDYSNIRVIDSINTVEKLIDRSFEEGLAAVALTDHDTLSGHVKAIKHYEKNYADKNFKLILGNEIYLTRDGMSESNYQKGEKLYHFLLLALDDIGHRQLRELSTRAWSRYTTKFTKTPTYYSDLKEVIGQEKGHIIATTACIQGIPATLFNVYGAHKSFAMINKKLEELEDIFGVGNFFIELQPVPSEEQIEYNKFAINYFWEKYPFVFTTDSHFSKKEDAVLHKQFLRSGPGGFQREIDRFYANKYIMNYEDLAALFPYIEDNKLETMRLNTLNIADRVKGYTLESPQIVPTVPIKITKEHLKNIEIAKEILEKQDFPYFKKYLNDQDINNQFFIASVIKGLFDEDKVKKSNLGIKYWERLEYELEQLWETSVKIKQPISKYFITMARMIDIIWTEGDSLVGVSRGSAGGFLINYLLGITQMDPLRQALELPAWRFIHKDRPGLPDIDIDTEGHKRKKVFEKVQEYFNSIGGDLINVCTFGTEKSKSALRTAARGLKIPDETVAYIVSMIPNERGFDWTLSQCMYGEDEKQPIKKFQEEMNRHKELWNLASKIEGLITRVGVHASGVIAMNETIYTHNSLMKTRSGASVTAWNLDDTEYAGGLKYDFLTINALDKIRTTLNLLLEDGMIDWEENLRKTYNKYLLPVNLNYDNKEMWKMVEDNSIVDLFQFDTSVGVQAIRSIKPKSILELAIANSVMRLMSEDGELPLTTYAKHKHNIQTWYRELNENNLSQDDIKILEKHLLPLSGVADSQESAMLLVMDKEISDFSVTEANSLRKAIAKKKFDVLEKTKKMFFKKGKELGTSQELLDYVWNVQIMRQAGYSFSLLHTMGYSTIALQEMNLAYNFPVIYWNTACLSTNAGAVTEEDYEVLIEDGIVDLEDIDLNQKSNKIQYGKVAAAINKFKKDFGLNVALPDINKARFGFTPDSYKNQVVFGLKGISKIGDKLIREIVRNRPYTSLNNFLQKLNGNGKTVVSRDRVILLIKAGAFDEIEERSRKEILHDFILSIADKKKRITLQNMAMLIKYGLVPEEYTYQQKVYNFTKYLRKNKYQDFYYKVDEIAEDFLNEFYPDIDYEEVEDNLCLFMHTWDSIYNKEMDKIRDWMKKEQDLILESLNNILLEEMLNKYAKGNELQWELESLNFYYSGHELEGFAEKLPVTSDKLTEIKDREVIGVWKFNGNPKYKISHIIGTVLDKDKSKHLVTFSTPEGVINIKLYRDLFSHYDKVIFKLDEDGKKEIIQDSFFKKGTFLFVSGIKDGDLFIPKVYKEHQIEPIIKFTKDENGNYGKGEVKIKSEN